MKNEEIFKKNFENVRFFIGDIRDKERLLVAFNNVDYVIHAAALKQVDTAEYNPFEFIKTNIQGTENVIQAATANKVKKVIALSTDKAVSPINLYGASKLCSDKLIIAANNVFGKNATSYSLVRYGNVMKSRGSVIPKFIENFEKKEIFKVTDEKMTRFNLTIQQCIDTVLWTLKKSCGGEIIIRKSPSYRIVDIAKAIDSKNKISIVGLRPGEKIHEELISKNENDIIYEIENFYVLLDKTLGNKIKKIVKKMNLKKKIKPFSYNSGDNKIFLSIRELKNLI